MRLEADSRDRHSLALNDKAGAQKQVGKPDARLHVIGDGGDDEPAFSFGQRGERDDLVCGEPVHRSARVHIRKQLAGDIGANRFGASSQGARLIGPQSNGASAAPR